ncbi:MAG: DNA repair protein RecN [Actinomycetota bacterium]|nr:DNA repair protein RecN [Actinomycetota bacterium]
MLVELAVENLGVIESARLAFGPGMTVLTGETGAGKTMVVEAINLLLGERPDPSRVRPGAAEAVVEGLFAVGDEEWVLRRVVPAEGRSRAYVSGSLSTASHLAELGAALLEVHGQHAQQALTQPRTQRDALDRFAGVDRTALVEARAAVTAVQRRLDELGGDDRTRAREIDLLRFQVDEIDAVAPVAGEDEQLRDEEELLAGALAHRSAAELAVALLSDEGGAGDQVARAEARLEGRGPFETVASRLKDLAAELSDCASELRTLGESIEPDEERLAAIGDRRQQLTELRRKYGDTVEDVIAYRAEVGERLAELSAHDEIRARLGDELAAARRTVLERGAELGAARRAAAPALAEAVQSHLADLALPGAVMEVVVDDTPELPGAGEAVEFRFATYAGGVPGSVSKVASGGELSRVMLSLRLVLSEGPPTMVFDEVDAGIGGSAAISVGRALSDLAATRQVFVVTHLAQVAAFADQQVRVTKSTSADEVTTTLGQLDDDDRVIELSRMLSGSPESDSAREHARELLDTVRSNGQRQRGGQRAEGGQRRTGGRRRS